MSEPEGNLIYNPESIFTWKKNNSTQELSTSKYTEREDLIYGTKGDEQINLQHFNLENQNFD